MRGLDASFSRIPRPVARKLRQAGYRVFVQNCWTGAETPAAARGNLENFIAEDFIPAIYVVEKSSLPGEYPVNVAYQLLPDLWGDLSFVGIDAEPIPEVPDVQVPTILRGIEQAESLGLRAPVYTARYYWREHLGNPTDLARKWLWNAFYDSDADIDFPSWPYGGWTPDKVMGEQYQGTTDVADLVDGVDTDLYYVDLNTFVDAFILGGEKPMRAIKAMVTIGAGNTYGFALISGWAEGKTYRQPVVQNNGISSRVPTTYLGRDSETGAALVYVDLGSDAIVPSPLTYEVLVEEMTYL